MRLLRRFPGRRRAALSGPRPPLARRPAPGRPLLPWRRDWGLARQQQPNPGAPSGGLATETCLLRPETQGFCWGREGRRPRCPSRGHCTAARTGPGGSRVAERQVTRSHVNSQVTQKSDVTVPKATHNNVNCCGPCQDGHSFLPNFYPKNYHVNRKAKFKKCPKPTRKGEQQTKGKQSLRVKPSSRCSELGPVTAPGAAAVGSSVGKRRESDGNAVADSHGSPRLNMLKCHHDCGRTGAADARGVGRKGHSHRDEWP